MSQTITLTLPDNFFQPAQRTAKATNQPIEEVLLHALQASLPSLEGLPDDFLENLTALDISFAVFESENYGKLHISPIF